MIEQTKKKYRITLLVGLINHTQSEEESKEYIDELAFLSETAGGKVMGIFIQKRDLPNPKTFIGSGKLIEIKESIKLNKVTDVIFDDELSPTQQRNLNKELECNIIDRTGLILDIFAQRAKTSTSRTQVELAQYEYLLPRLKGMWTHLERQKGGIGMRGPGETEIETDRRIVRNKISQLKNKLKVIDKQMSVQRGNRGAMVRVALIGYTNVGKSTLMNVLSKSDTFAENKLFATLDTTVRKVVFKNIPFLLTDTVGFIRKLPTQLIESFKSTLDEVIEADLLFHVVDISHPHFEKHIEAVNKILKEINSTDKIELLIFNKIDAYKEEKFDEDNLLIERTKKNFTIKEWKQSWMAKTGGNVLFISATEKKNIEELREKAYEMIKQIHITRFPYNNFLYDDTSHLESPSE